MEKAGIPTVTVYTPAMTEYMEQWQEFFGMPNLRTYCSTMPNRHTYQDLARAVVPKLVEGLTTPLTEKEKRGGTIPREERPRIAFTGTYEECLEFLGSTFIPLGTGAPQTQYTTGASVVLPTPELVAKMLTGTSHSLDEVIGTMLPTGLELTVEKVAINAVMAGCKPEYLPVVLAFAKVMATEGALFGQGGGGGRTPIVSGPVTKEIGMDFINTAGAGNPANNSIGQVITLMFRNFAGGISGGGAASVLASAQPVAFAEELDSPWTLLGEDVGFRRDQSVVAFTGGGGGGGVMTPPAYRVDGEAKWLEGLTGAVSGAFSPNPTIMMNPNIARDLATRQGMSKQDVKQHLYDNCFITKKNYVQRATRLRPVLKEIEALPDDAKIRVIGNRYGYRSIRTIYSSKDGRVIASEDTPDNICIVVAGGEEQFGGMAGSSQSPYRNWIESVDAWR